MYYRNDNSTAGDNNNNYNDDNNNYSYNDDYNIHSTCNNKEWYVGENSDYIIFVIMVILPTIIMII